MINRKDIIKENIKELERKLDYVRNNKSLFPNPEKEISFLMTEIDNSKIEYGESV